ncbi:hypothetical protein [Paenibacillus sp. MDMC362]|uniref:hypothetical protein n=1 Tax=Paenibacillus sp. MDMC362 TaxID=2977365 RepID=UPI000DC60DA3|nr:hypothetical protein [Paenibacillus sp. MDMC362]RAR40613.1 hypothetical protein DP091_28155 [Paenibacillus sp. MDMC362]
MEISECFLPFLNTTKFKIRAQNSIYKFSRIVYALHCFSNRAGQHLKIFNRNSRQQIFLIFESYLNITVNAFDPGMMPGTGLAQSYTPIMRFVWNYLMPVLTLFYPNVNTVRQSGKALASLVTDSRFNQTTGKYFEGTKQIKSSELSYNHENRKQLWEASVALTSLNQTETILETGI